MKGSKRNVEFRNTQKTNQEFINEIKELVGDEYTFLDPYITAKTKIRVRHNVCGNIYEIKPNTFLSANTRCPRCSINHKRTQKEFLNDVKILFGNEYTFLEEYRGSNIYTAVRHNKCGCIRKVRPSDFLNGSYVCPKCNKINNGEKNV